MKTWLLAVGALMYATTSVSGHGVLVEPPVRIGMGKTTQNPSGKKLVGEKVFRDLPADRNKGDSGCGSQVSTGNPGPGLPTVTWNAGQKVKICWENTIPHPEVPGTRSPGIRVSIAYTPQERFDKNILLKDLDGGLKGMYCQEVTLDATKTCNNCVLQWAWVSIPDGGAYVGCADVRILPRSTTETCRASLWVGTKGNCAAGNGLYNFEPMLNVHPGQAPPIQRVCGAGSASGNWAAKSGSHNGYTQYLTTQKGDIKYGQTTVRRLGPGAGCPANAKTPPKLAPGPGPTPAPITTPAPGPITTTPAPGPTTTLKPICINGVCNCRPGSITELKGVKLRYPINVGVAMNGGQTMDMTCPQANPGYTSTKQTHVGFQVRCSKSKGTYEFGPKGGSCAAFKSCSSIANNPGAVCGTAPYNQAKANSPCNPSCKSACCQGGNVNPNPQPQPTPQPNPNPQPNPQPNPNPGLPGIGLGGCAAPCYGITTFSADARNVGQCGMTRMNGRMNTNLVPDGTCRKLNSGGKIASYYRLGCQGDPNTATGVYACKDPSCTTCAVTNFRIARTDLDQCLVKPFNCLVGDQASCLSEDVIFSTKCSAFDAATSWAMSLFGALVAVTMVAV